MSTVQQGQRRTQPVGEGDRAYEHLEKELAQPWFFEGMAERKVVTVGYMVWDHSARGLGVLSTEPHTQSMPCEEAGWTELGAGRGMAWMPACSPQEMLISRDLPHLCSESWERGALSSRQHCSYPPNAPVCKAQMLVTNTAIHHSHMGRQEKTLQGVVNLD